MDDAIYIIEFKVDAGGDNVGTALQQIKDKNYQEKYLSDGRTIYLIGIDFDAKERAVANFDWELV
ncbi:MAG: PD-(D/E)XK nuclease domain-containing protein [Thermodesulfobacteriota bacterium]|nr:PD-(D/E)XK nuclease domain-containing protein [Thermodesulfobacteriota bacterium]